MAFIETKDENAVEGAAAEMYADAVASSGYLPNMARIFSHRPEVMTAWEALIGAIKGNMDLRRYEVATLGAARQLRSSYCMLAHSRVLMREGASAEAVKAIATGTRHETISTAEEAILAFAAKVAADATSVTQSDIDALRSEGLGDAEIFDVAATAAVRCFFSKLLDALGAQPDAAYLAMGEDLRAVLTPGRAIEEPDKPQATP